MEKSEPAHKSHIKAWESISSISSQSRRYSEDRILDLRGIFDDNSKKLKNRSNSTDDFNYGEPLMTSVLPAEAIQQVNSSKDLMKKVIFRPTPLPIQSWSFKDYIDLEMTNPNWLDFYSSKAARQKLIQVGQQVEVTTVRKRFYDTDQYDAADKDTQIILPFSFDQANAALKNQRDADFGTLLLGKDYKRQVQIEDRNSLINLDYYVHKMTMKEIAHKYEVSKGHVSKLTSRFAENKPDKVHLSREIVNGLPSRDTVMHYIEQCYEVKGYIALSYRQLELELRLRFPVLQELSSSDIRRTLKENLGLKKVSFQTRPASVKPTDSVHLYHLTCSERYWSTVSP